MIPHVLMDSATYMMDMNSSYANTTFWHFLFSLPIRNTNYSEIGPYKLFLVIIERHPLILEFTEIRSENPELLLRF